MTSSRLHRDITPRQWRWATTLGQPHPLADRVGQPVRILCRGSNGNELMEFPDGYRTVAPWRAALRGNRDEQHGHGAIHDTEGTID